MTEQPTQQERIEQRSKDFTQAFPELTATWEEWFPGMALKLVLGIDDELQQIDRADGWGEVAVVIERHRVALIKGHTTTKFDSGRSRRREDGAADEQP